LGEEGRGKGERKGRGEKGKGSESEKEWREGGILCSCDFSSGKNLQSV